jgi:hypothetical protein
MNLRALNRVPRRIAVFVTVLVAAIVFSAIAVSQTAAHPPRDFTPCQKLQDVCSTTCEDSTYHGVGLCREGKDGAEVPISIECCCCTDGYKKRVWIP